jgi:rubredoxin
MVSISYSSLTFSATCPHCASPLFTLSDMWGPFYACEECGYEFDPLELEPKHLRPQGEPAFAGSFWLNRDNGSDDRRMVWQGSGAVPGLRLG